MVKRTKTANDNSRLSSPARPLKRPKPTEKASQGSSTSSRKSGPSKLTPPRSSTRKCRSTAKVAAMEESSDSDCTPPPSIISRSPMKKGITEKRVPRNEKEPTEPDVIDLTIPQTLSPKSPKKRPKTKRHLPVDLDTFINLCSDEEINPQPRKKRKVLPADEVIFISSGDEAELPGTQFVQRTPSLEHPEEGQVSKEGYVSGHSSACGDPGVPNTFHEMETYHNHPDMSTPPPVSSLENGSPESAIVDITASQDMTGVEEISTSWLSPDRSNALDQESSVKSLMSDESCSTSFCNTPGPAPKQQIHQVVLKQAKRALLTSLIFARPMRSLGRMSRPRAKVILQCPNSSKHVALIESSVDERTSLHQGDCIVIDAPMSSTVSSADTGPVKATTSDKFLDDIRISSASPLREVGEVPASCTGETSAKDMLSLEILVGENSMMKTHDTSTLREGQTDDHPSKSSFTKAEPDPNTGPVGTTTCEEIRVLSTSPMETVKPVFSARVQAGGPSIPASCLSEISAKDVPSLEIVVGEMVKTHDTSTPREGQADDHPSKSGFTKTNPNLNTGSVNAATPVDTITCEEIHVLPASPVMEVDETVKPLFSLKATDDRSVAEEAVPGSCTGETSPKDVPSLEIVVGENAMTKTKTPHKGQADDHPSKSSFTKAEPDPTTGPVNAATPTTCEEIRVLSTSPMEVDETVQPVFSARVQAGGPSIPASCIGETSAKDVPSLEIVVGEDAMKAHDTYTPRERQADDHPPEAGFSEAKLMQNSENQPSGVAEDARMSTDTERVGDIPIRPCATTTDLETSSRSAVQADDPIIHPTFRDTHPPSRDPFFHKLFEASNNPDEPLDNPLPRETSPILQSYINSSIFEFEHSPNLTLQILFTSNKILDDVNDLAISLPCYPERLRY